MTFRSLAWRTAPNFHCLIEFGAALPPMKHIRCWMMPNIKRNGLNVDRLLNCVWIYVRGSCLACVKHVKVKYLMNNAFELYDCRMVKSRWPLDLNKASCPGWQHLGRTERDWRLSRLTEALGADLIDASCPGWLRPVGLTWEMPPVQAEWGLWGWTDWWLLSRLTEACGADLIDASCPGWLRHVGLIWLMPPA